ncbi:hypothetical protein V3C99_014398 [Haemonchus contortus]|uniref:ShKT domain-containing protein n=1 Tax=Haemonchus contortus TaxID=6289 RepID=A0A7I4YSN8_HAECO
MLLIILFFNLFEFTRGGAITDLNCTYRVGGEFKYAESAVNCRNKMSDANCQIIYGDAVKVDTNDQDRNAKCAGNPVNQDLLHTAISFCPKQCGYCCLTPAYNCQNKLQPRYPCSSVSQDMCESNAWRSILEEDCPKTCGLCDSGSCIDEAPGCNLDNAFICQSKNLQSFVQRYCKKTCGLCNTATSTTAPTGAPGVACGSNPNCVNWVRNGFCNNAFYSEAHKRQYCGRLCGLC